MEKVENALHVLSHFQILSGLKINTEKTQILRLGSKRNSVETLCPHVRLKWVTEICILGITISHNVYDLIKLNFDQKLEKAKNIIQTWQSRDLSLYGKVTIIKSHILSITSHCVC